ncbi:MAG: GNAT family N-acetyltransferase [Erysipelotrichaceae bacterium]|nr:GNAT family N-acetyltransferase [Erysipelotrichaceae bacterium]
MIVIETERLQIRTLDESDAPRMAEYRNKREVKQYQSWRHYSVRDAKKLIRMINKYPFRGERYDMMQYAVDIKGGIMIGDLHITMTGKRSFMIGYTFDSLYWHHGYARESVAALIDYMVANYPIKKVLAYIMTYNEASRRLLLDLGFEKFDESKFLREESYQKFIEEDT